MMGKAEATFTGSNSVGDGLTFLLDLSANNAAAGKVSDAGFLLENDKVGFQWAFRTTETNSVTFKITHSTSHIIKTKNYILSRYNYRFPIGG